MGRLRLLVRMRGMIVFDVDAREHAMWLYVCTQLVVHDWPLESCALDHPSMKIDQGIAGQDTLIL